MGYRVTLTRDGILSRFDTVPACNGRTDGHPAIAHIALAWRRAVKICGEFSDKTIFTRKILVTFRVSGRQREMYCVHARLCVCLSVRGRMPTLLHGSGSKLREWYWMSPIVVHYWSDLQSVHRLRCYGNITRMRNVSEYVIVLALCLVHFCDYDYCAMISRHSLCCGRRRVSLHLPVSALSYQNG